MQISSCHFNSIRIPFRESFRHSSFNRKETETILSIVNTKNNSGYGEGCPREYVTSESIKSSLFFLEKNRSDWNKLINIESIIDWLDRNRSIVDRNPAAFCSFELAFLDLLGRENKKSTESIVGLNEQEMIGKHFILFAKGEETESALSEITSSIIKANKFDLYSDMFGKSNYSQYDAIWDLNISNN